MADSSHEMLAKRRQSVWMTMMADDTKSVAYMLTPTSKEQRSSPAELACRHRPRTTRLPTATVL